jgi:hypothetical protein
MRIGLMTLAVAALVAVAAAGTGSATTPATVSLIGCYFASGGSVTVPAGVDLAVRFGVAEKNRGLTQNFISAQTTTASVNGVPLAGASGLWSAPEAVGNAFATFWSAPVGVLAAPGDSVVVSFQVSLSRPVPGGKDPATGRQLFSGPGDILPAGFGCVITAV